MTIKFQFDRQEYPINITYYDAIKVLPEKFGISLTKIFTSEDEAQQTMQSLVIDDEKTLALAWHYVHETASFEEDEFLRKITGKDLEQFREDFWSAVVNFSGPLKRNLLREIWNQFKRDLKAAVLPNETSNASPSDYKPEE